MHAKCCDAAKTNHCKHGTSRIALDENAGGAGAADEERQQKELREGILRVHAAGHQPLFNKSIVALFVGDNQEDKATCKSIEAQVSLAHHER